MNLDDIKAHLRANPKDAERLFNDLTIVSRWYDVADCYDDCEIETCPRPCPDEITVFSSRIYGDGFDKCSAGKNGDRWKWRVGREKTKVEGEALTLDEAKAKCDEILRANPKLILVDEDPS